MLFLILLGWGHECGMPDSISTLSRKQRTVMRVPSSVESVQQHRTSSEKRLRKSGTWLRWTLIQHLTMYKYRKWQQRKCQKPAWRLCNTSQVALKTHQTGSVTCRSIFTGYLQPHQSQLLTEEWPSRILDWYYQLLERTWMKRWFKTINRQNIEHEDWISQSADSNFIQVKKRLPVTDQDFGWQRIFLNNSLPCYGLLAPRKYAPASLRKIATIKTRQLTCELGQKNGHFLPLILAGMQIHVPHKFIPHTSVSIFFLWKEALSSVPETNLAPFSQILIKPSSKWGLEDEPFPLLMF